MNYQEATNNLLATFNGSYIELHSRIVSLLEGKGLRVLAFTKEECPYLNGRYRPGIIQYRSDMRIREQLFTLGHEAGHRMSKKGRAMEAFAKQAKEKYGLTIDPKDIKDVQSFTPEEEARYYINPQKTITNPDDEQRCDKFAYRLIKMLIRRGKSV